MDDSADEQVPVERFLQEHDRADDGLEVARPVCDANHAVRTLVAGAQTLFALFEPILLPRQNAAVRPGSGSDLHRPETLSHDGLANERPAG